MAILDILELVALIGAITFAIWYIGRDGMQMGDVFGTLFTHGPRSRPGVGQEDDDAWERIRADRRSSARGAEGGPDDGVVPPVPTSRIRPTS